MIVLGLNAYHADSAACLIVDGKLVAAAEEERFRRIKHWAGLPTQAIDYCLREGRLKLARCRSYRDQSKTGRKQLAPARVCPDASAASEIDDCKRSGIFAAPPRIKETLEAHYQVALKAEIHHVEHHLAHLASAFLVSGFNEAACLSIDGFGDFASTAFGFGEGDNIKIDNRVYFPHSLGIFYSALTQFIGFPNYGDEYKVMGLAPYGEPAFLEQMREMVRIRPDGTFRLNLKYFRHHTDNVSYSWQNCAPEVGTLYRNNADRSSRSRRENRTNRSNKNTRTSRVRCRRFTKKRSSSCSTPCTNCTRATISLWLADVR